MDEDEDRRIAREIASARYAFRWHAVAYAVVNPGLVGLWYFTGPSTGDYSFPWPVFPIVFWGIGLVAHYVGAYRTVGEAWIEQETEKVLAERVSRGRP